MLQATPHAITTTLPRPYCEVYGAHLLEAVRIPIITQLAKVEREHQARNNRKTIKAGPPVPVGLGKLFDYGVPKSFQPVGSIALAAGSSRSLKPTLANSSARHA
jgi:hypothetical protein